MCMEQQLEQEYTWKVSLHPTPAPSSLSPQGLQGSCFLYILPQWWMLVEAYPAATDLLLT